MKYTRVKASLSKHQWEKIESIIGNDKADISKYIIQELKTLEEKCLQLNELQDCVSCQQEKKFTLNPAAQKRIRFLQKKTGIQDPSLIVSRFILMPLLLK